MKYRFVAVVVLLIMCWLELSTLAVTAPTSDEPTYLVRGYAFVTRGKDRIASCDPCSPVLSGWLIGAGLLLEPDLKLPAEDDPIWRAGAGFDVHEVFMWANSVPPQRIAFWGRLPIIFVSLLLGAFIYRWASRRSGALPALGALAFYVFCPNMLAHSRLATTDALAAAAILVSAYAFDQALERPRRATLVGSGVALGLALATKISAVWLPVAFALQSALRAWQNRVDRRAVTTPLKTLLVSYVVSGLTLWAIYQFTFGPIEPGGIPVPAPAYWGDWQSTVEYLKNPVPSYLLGQISNRGWWYYYPIAFLIKTPLPVLILGLLGLVQTIRARSWARDLPLLLTPGLYMISLLVSPHDLGYRYLLPLLPFIFVYGAGVVAAARHARWSRIAMGLLLA